MKIESILKEWYSKNRRMGCNAATAWFCKRAIGFYPERLPRYTESGEYFSHTVATNGYIRIDLAPYADKPKPLTS